MPSPFPGMNPYFEQDRVWHSFHQSFIPMVLEALVPQVRPKYIVKIEEHIFLHGPPDGEERLFIGRPDVTLGESPARAATAPQRNIDLLEAPTFGLMEPTTDIERLSYLEIRDKESLDVVTVIELLSPSNKPMGRDRVTYIAKRSRILESPVHLVEIDLLRGGARLPLIDMPDCDYCAIVSRAEDRPRVGIWPILLRDPLPPIPIPLQSPDPAAKLELQALLHKTYDLGGYEDYMYRELPQPKLRPADAEWAAQFLPR